jgi:hypothetical protein
MYVNFLSDDFTFRAIPPITGFRTINAVIQHIVGMANRYPEKRGTYEQSRLKIIKMSFMIVLMPFVLFKNSAMVTPENMTIHSTEKMPPRPDVMCTMIE